MRLILAFLMFSSVSLANAQEIRNLDGFFNRVDKFLTTYVNDGRVDYKGIKKAKTPLEDLVTYISKADLSRENASVKKAFYINTYSLMVINAVIATQAQKVNDDKDFFEGYKYLVAGNKMTLNDLEAIIQKDKDPRVHFSLVCGAQSCPKLASFAYRPEKLDEQLNERTKLTMNDNAYVAVDTEAKTVLLSSIFDWYAKDFKNSEESVLTYINKYRTTKIPMDYKVAFSNYNWQLNEK